MSFVKVYIHFVWSTKNKVPYLSTPELRIAMWKHIRENAKKKDVYIDFIGGHKEHCHCLVSLGDDQTMRKIMQLIKGESSYWMNKQSIIKGKFEWQDEYYAVSVSESLVDKVRDYIKDQERHHAHKTWQDEYNEFIKKYGFEKFKDYE